MAQRPPAEIARETFRELATRRLAPSPDNYRRVYDEMAGSTSPAPFPATSLRQIARILPAQTPVQKRLLAQFEAATEASSWQDLQRTIVSYANLGLGLAPATAAETENPPHTAQRAPNPEATDAPSVAAAPSTGMTQELREQVGRLITSALPALGTDDARFLEQAEALVAELRQSDVDVAADGAPPLKTQLGNFAHRLSFVAEEQAAIRAGLLQSLQLVFRNIAELSVDERWLHGQAEALMTAATPPLALRRIDDLQARLRDVIFKQTEAKARTVQAQERVRGMLASFIDRLGTVTEESSVYHEKIERCAERISAAATLDEIAPVLQEVLGATRSMSLDVQRHHDELVSMREATETAQASVHRLQQELDKASTQARHDPLTGTLNRKGLDEALNREISRACRRGTSLCIAMLDVDDFKAINDRLGHSTGDAALQHLTSVAREAMRPQDLLGRWGGEEFVVLMPDTPADQGVQAMQRLQRELTKRFFLKDNEKLLITFSAGVTEMVGKESAHDAIGRADSAMYLAKRAGKNRVMLG
jgi:diguanylate cyclase